jgi:hypothetical protein
MIAAFTIFVKRNGVTPFAKGQVGAKAQAVVSFQQPLFTPRRECLGENHFREFN